VIASVLAASRNAAPPVSGPPSTKISNPLMPEVLSVLATLSVMLAEDEGFESSVPASKLSVSIAPALFLPQETPYRLREGPRSVILLRGLAGPRYRHG
jgi:hypothetical protein